MTLLASIESLFETYDCPFFKRPPTIVQTILIPQQLSEWVHQIYFEQKKLNQLSVVKLVQHPLESIKPNIACSIMYSIIRQKVQEVCQHIRNLIFLSFKQLKSQRQTNCDLKHESNSWNMNYKRFKKQNNEGTSRKIYGPIGHLICAYHNYLLDANKQVYDLWKLLYQCSQVKDLQFKTLQNTLNQTILDQLMKQYPHDMSPRQIMPTLSSFQKHDFIFKQMWGFQKRKIVVQFHPKPEMALQQRKTQKIKQIFNSVPKKVQKGQALQPQKPIALPKSQIGINTLIKGQVNNLNRLTQKQAAKKKGLQEQLKFLQIQQQIQQLDSAAKLKILQKILTTMKDSNQSKDPMSKLSSNILSTLSPSQIQFLGRTIGENQEKQNQQLDKYCQDVENSSSSSSEQQILILRKGNSDMIISSLQPFEQQLQIKKAVSNIQMPKVEAPVIIDPKDIQKPERNVMIDYFQKSDLQMQKRLNEPGRDIEDQKNQFMNYLKFKLGTSIYEDNDGKVTVRTTDPDKMNPIFDQICQIQANQRFGFAQPKKKFLQNTNSIQDKINSQKKQIKANPKSIVNKSKPIQKKQKQTKIHHIEDSKLVQTFPVEHDKQHHKMEDVADRLYELAKQRKKLIQQNAQLNENKGSGNLSKSLLQYLKQKHQNTKDCTVQYEQSFKCYLDNHPCTVTSKKMKIDSSKLPFQWANQLEVDQTSTSGFFQKTKRRLLDECFKFQTSDRSQNIIDEPDDFQNDTKKKKKNKKKNKKKKNQQKSTNDPQKIQENKDQQTVIQLKQKNKILKRCEIQQIMQEEEEIQKQRQQQLLMQKKITQYQYKTRDYRVGQDKNKKLADNKNEKLKEQLNESQQNLFSFLDTLQIKDQNRQKCIVTQESIKNFHKKAGIFLNKKLGCKRKANQGQIIDQTEQSSYKIGSIKDNKQASEYLKVHEIQVKGQLQANKKQQQRQVKKGQTKQKLQIKGKTNNKKKAKR